MQQQQPQLTVDHHPPYRSIRKTPEFCSIGYSDFCNAAKLGGVRPERDQPSCRVTEATLPVECLKVGLEVDMQPMGAALSRQRCCILNELACDTLSPVVRMNACIENKRMATAVPCDIYKSDNPIFLVRTYMSEAA